MRILYLNIYEGCKEPERLERIIDFIKSQNLDVFGVSELYYWDKDEFEKLRFFLKAVGFPYYIFGRSENNYNTCLFSKTKFEAQLSLTKGFRSSMVLGAVVANNTPIKVILTHLAAKDEDLRLKELDLIFQQIDPKFPALLMGDMNSLSSQDAYDESVVLSEMQKAGLDKFGKGKLRYDAIKKILDFGFADSLKQFQTNFEYSVPTAFNIDEAHFTKLRLDYIFVTKNLLPYLIKSEVVRTKETNQLSDHFPVVAEFNF